MLFSPAVGCALVLPAVGYALVLPAVGCALWVLVIFSRSSMFSLFAVFVPVLRPLHLCFHQNRFVVVYDSVVRFWPPPASPTLLLARDGGALVPWDSLTMRIGFAFVWSGRLVLPAAVRRWSPTPLCGTLRCVHPHNESLHRGLLSLRGPLGRPTPLGNRFSSLSLAEVVIVAHHFPSRVLTTFSLLVCHARGPHDLSCVRYVSSADVHAVVATVHRLLCVRVCV